MRLEPNALLALATGCAMGVLICSAAIFGEQGHLLKYLISTVAVTAAYIPLDNWRRRRANQPARPLINLESTRSAMWSNLYPAAIGIAAFIPLFQPNKDYGLLIVIAAVWFAMTVNSALMARKA